MVVVRMRANDEVNVGDWLSKPLQCGNERLAAMPAVDKDRNVLVPEKERLACDRERSQLVHCSKILGNAVSLFSTLTTS
jgi:hypothetical protein